MPSLQVTWKYQELVLNESLTNWCPTKAAVTCAKIYWGDFLQQWGWWWWWWCPGFWYHVDSQVDANVLEKHTVSYLLGWLFIDSDFSSLIPCPWLVYSLSIPLIQYKSLHLPALPLKPWRWKHYVSPKHWHLPTSLHGTKTQNIIYWGALNLMSKFQETCDWWWNVALSLQPWEQTTVISKEAFEFTMIEKAVVNEVCCKTDGMSFY
jgi:hypothetical protein